MRAHDVDIPRDDPWIGIGDSCADESEEGQDIRKEHLAVTEEGMAGGEMGGKKVNRQPRMVSFYERVHARSA